MFTITKIDRIFQIFSNWGNFPFNWLLWAKKYVLGKILLNRPQYLQTFQIVEIFHVLASILTKTWLVFFALTHSSNTFLWKKPCIYACSNMVRRLTYLPNCWNISLFGQKVWGIFSFQNGEKRTQTHKHFNQNTSFAISSQEMAFFRTLTHILIV